MILKGWDPEGKLKPQVLLLQYSWRSPTLNFTQTFCCAIAEAQSIPGDSQQSSVAIIYLTALFEQYLAVEDWIARKISHSFFCSHQKVHLPLHWLQQCPSGFLTYINSVCDGTQNGPRVTSTSYSESIFCS